MGYGYALSTQRRSASRPKVTTIIFDEFLVDTDNPYQRYLPNEFTQFNHLYETVARGRDITVFFIGNAFSMVNPYFLGMNIRISDIEENKIYSGKFWTFIEWRDEGFIEMRKQTQHYQATAGTDFSTHAFDNKYFLDNDEFLKHRSKDSEHHFSISYLNKLYGVWVDWDEGRYYVTTKGAKTSKQKTVSMSLADNSPNNVNIRKYRNMPFMKAFRHAVDTNEVYFDTQETYNNLQEVVYLLRTVT